MDDKICPLMSGPYINAEGYEDVNRQDCLGEKCAWFTLGRCAVYMIAPILDNLLTAIRER